MSVQSGMLVKDFCQRIDENFGLALPVLGNYAGQTVGGLVATSSHGSSKHCMTMVSSSEQFQSCNFNPVNKRNIINFIW